MIGKNLKKNTIIIFGNSNGKYYGVFEEICMQMFNRLKHVIFEMDERL